LRLQSVEHRACPGQQTTAERRDQTQIGALIHHDQIVEGSVAVGSERGLEKHIGDFTAVRLKVDGAAIGAKS